MMLRSLSLAWVSAGAIAFAAAAVTGTGTPTKSYPTVSFNASAGATYITNTDYSNEQLAFLWNQVGPISTHPIITATVEPTPEPSLARPGFFHPLVSSTFSSLSSLKLPANFAWGFAASAYQFEGAAKAEGRGPSIWDLLSHRVPGQVSDDSNGDVVGQHYYLYKQDFQRLKEFGTPYYSPSISWPRIFPFGHGVVNEEGLRHYDDYFAELVGNGIKPALSLFHWDTPLALFNEYGGWTNEKIVDDYFNYATFVIERYDKYVPIWYTFNEPQYCNWQYSYYPSGDYFPSYGVEKGLEARFLCGLRTQRLQNDYFEPLTNNTEDLEAVQRNYDFVLGWFGGPWTDGDYPQSMKDTLGTLLPTLTQEEKSLIKGSCDFFAIDAYTGYYVSAPSSGIESCATNSSSGGYPECVSTQQTDPSGFGVGPAADSGATWLKSTPAGIRKFLNHITKELFPSVTDIVVSEFGFAEPYESDYDGLSDALWDLRRADYLQGFLDNILLAIAVDGVNVTGAFVWSIYDNFEWGSGVKTRFGVQYLNYTSLERTPKASAFQLLDWFRRGKWALEGVSRGCMEPWSHDYGPKCNGWKTSPTPTAAMEDIVPMHGLDFKPAVNRQLDAGISTDHRVASAQAEHQQHQRQHQQQQRPYQTSLQRANSLNSASNSNAHSHVRSTSAPTKTAARKRLSLSFPINPNSNSLASPRHASPVASASASAASSPPLSAVDHQLAPDDTMAFLTALAASERRVLELKEELSKAESELAKLKKQWAVHEATKKRFELTNIESLRLSPSLNGTDKRDSLVSPIREEYQARRKATLETLTANSTRKVFPSQRHTRALSLLSPNRTQYSQPFPPPDDTDTDSHPSLNKRHTMMNPPILAAGTLSPPPTRPQSLVDLSTVVPKRNSQDALLRTGRQFAEDFKEGLWTFIEDLRQATVGDEGIQSAVNSGGIRASPNPALRKQSSKTSIRSAASAGTTMQRSNSKDGEKRMESLIDLEDGDYTSASSSSARWSSSTGLSDPVTGSRASTPRSSTRYLTPPSPPLLPSFSFMEFLGRVYC
ncbi:hypothetical protein RUND412_006994 [Rhizina undulata]